MRTLIAVLCATMLCGCGSTLTPSQLEPPAAVLLSPPPKLPEVKEGDDAVKLLIETRRRYLGLADRHRRLQRWVKTVRGE